MKSLLSIFKSPMSLEKTTESIQIQSPSNDNLIFIVKYKTGVLKTFKIPIVNCEALQAYYLKDSTPNSATLQPKIMWELLANLYNSQDEITWKVTKNNLIIKNFLEPEDECEGLRTEISVNKSEFDNFKIEKETEVTFCLKELRAVLLFSDGVSLPLTFNFSTSSKPIVFIIKSDSFEVNIVVSTLSGDTSECSTNFSLPGTINRLITSKNVDNGNLSGNQTEPIQLISSDSGSESASASASASSSGNDKGRDAERLKHIFGKCFQWEKYDVKNLPGYNVVIASDSDSDV